MFLGQPVVVEEHVLERRVDAALQPVRGARHRAGGREFGFEEREQLALAEQSLQPPVAAAQLLVGPPPLLFGRLRVGGVVLREGAFGYELSPMDVPCVERLAPPGRRLGVTDLGEPVGELLELLAGLQPGLRGQVRPRVALHVHQAPLDAGGRPGLVAGALRAAQPVRYRHVRSRDAREQRHIGGLALVRAPLEARHLAVPAVDGYDQAPAVVHVRAVRHHRMMFHPARRDGGPDVPAPRGALAQGPRIAVRVARGLARAAEQPSKERVELPGPLRVLLWHRRAQRAGCALPALHPFAVRPFFFIGRPHTGHFFALLDFVLMRPAHHRDAPIFPPGKITPRHAYSHKAKPGL